VNGGSSGFAFITKNKIMKQNLKFKKITIGEMQKLRNEYCDKVSALVKEFTEKTGLRIIDITCEDPIEESWYVKIHIPV